MPSLCAGARCLNAPLSAASRVVPVPRIQRHATVPTSVSPIAYEAKRAQATSPWNRLIWCGGRSKPDISFAVVWMHCGRHARNGPTVNWRMSQPLPERLKKGAPDKSPGRNRQRNRYFLRLSGDCRSGLRSRGDGGAATSSATGRARTGATPERRHFRSCRTGCFGQFAAQTPFWHYAAASSTGGLRIIGRAARAPDLHFHVAHPQRVLNSNSGVPGSSSAACPSGPEFRCKAPLRRMMCAK